MYWLIKIFEFNFFLGTLMILDSFILYLALKVKLGLYIFIPFILLTLFLQYKTTQVQNLTEISNYNRYIIDTRLKEYPPLRLPIAYWFEEKKETIAIFRILGNFFEALDLNLYFFGNFPRQRVGVPEFDKFSYLLLPFFLYGLLKSLDQKKYFPIVAAFGPPLVFISVIGHQNRLGIFSLLPFITVMIFFGIEMTIRKFIKS